MYIIPACDGSLSQFTQVLEATSDLDVVSGYKIGSILALSAGIKKVVDHARMYTTKPLIYDHQKAGNDIPDTSIPFVSLLAWAGVDSFIVFPFTGPGVLGSLVKEAKNADIKIIVGAHMTHACFLKEDGGHISLESIMSIYSRAAWLGVRDYVVPGNKPEVALSIRDHLIGLGVDPVLYAPGFITQGGQFGEFDCHAIIGRAIVNQQDIRSAVLELVEGAKNVR